MIALPDTDEDSLLDLDATMAAELARRKKEERPDLVGLLKIQRLFFEMGKISTRCGNCNHPRVSHVDGEGPCSECDCQKFEPKPLDDARVASILRSSGFPRPWLTLPRGRLWLRSDVIEWTENWTQKPGRPHKPRRKRPAGDGEVVPQEAVVEVVAETPVIEEEPSVEEIEAPATEEPEPTVPCPSCGYELNLANEEASQLPEAKAVLRCPRCGWLGQVWRSPLKLI